MPCLLGCLNRLFSLFLRACLPHRSHSSPERRRERRFTSLEGNGRPLCSLPLVHSCLYVGVFMFCRCSCRDICDALLPCIYCETAAAASSLICVTRGSAEVASPRSLSPHLLSAPFIGLSRRRNNALWRVGNRCAENLPSACGIRDLASALFCPSLPAVINLCSGTVCWRRRVSWRESAHSRVELVRRYAAYGGCAGLPS